MVRKEKRHSEEGGTYIVPVLLSTRPSKGVELGVDAGILSQDNVAVELKDTGWGTTESLLVEESIPDAGGAVLRVAEARRVNEALLASRVGAEEGSETKGLDSLDAEELNE